MKRKQYIKSDEYYTECINRQLQIIVIAMIMQGDPQLQCA
jgi:hypothetical protein